MAIDTDSFSVQMRDRGIDRANQRVLISTLEGSEEAQDLTEPPNCNGFGRIRHFRRTTAPGWPENSLPIDPAAKALDVPAPDILRAQVFQNAVCNWRCWYCYVDFPLLAGNTDRASMLSADEMLDLFLSVENRPNVLDLSGGQPDLVPEWIAWTATALQKRGLESQVYLWSDDNLSNDYFWAKLTKDERRTLDDHSRYGKVCCFKGYDPVSFAFNTGADPSLFDRQFELMSRLIRDTRIDLYAYATFTRPTPGPVEKLMAQFVDRLQALDEFLPLRLIPLRIEAFTPAASRLASRHRRAMTVQDEAAAIWRAELSTRFNPGQIATTITSVPLREN